LLKIFISPRMQIFCISKGVANNALTIQTFVVNRYFTIFATLLPTFTR
jgi:hypothetical protein